MNCLMNRLLYADIISYFETRKCRKIQKKIKKIVNTDEDFISFERLEEFHLNFQKRCGLW